jgi:organic hydroperoxide reductase OsmC/OhrA
MQDLPPFIEKLDYSVELSWDGETGASVECDNCGDLRIDMPEEFSGNGRSPCPDQLFLASLGGCLLTTFLHFAKRLQLEAQDINISVGGKVSLRKGVGYRVGPVEARIRVMTDAEDVELAEKCSELARDYCHITRSIEDSVRVDVSIEVTASPHLNSL